METIISPRSTASKFHEWLHQTTIESVCTFRPADVVTIFDTDSISDVFEVRYDTPFAVLAGCQRR
jgi:hypothetical protein